MVCTQVQCVRIIDITNCLTHNLAWLQLYFCVNVIIANKSRTTVQITSFRDRCSTATWHTVSTVETTQIDITIYCIILRRRFNLIFESQLLSFYFSIVSLNWVSFKFDMCVCVCVCRVVCVHSNWDIASPHRLPASRMFCCNCFIFTALYGMQTRSSDENSVRPSLRPSVCPSVCQMRGLWQNGIKSCPDFFYHMKDHLS